MSIRLLVAPAAALLLAACVTPATAPSTTACNAAAVQPLLGRTATDSTIETARVTSGAGLVRVIKPGDAVTLDYRVERLNLYLDAAGGLSRATCG